MQWPGTRKRLVGKRATADIWRQNFSSCIFYLNRKNWNLFCGRAGWGACQVPSSRKLMFSLLVSLFMKLLASEGFLKPRAVWTPVSKFAHRLPKNADEGVDFPSIRKGLLSTVPGFPKVWTFFTKIWKCFQFQKTHISNLTKDLMLLLRTLTQTESSNRPTADRSMWFLCNNISYVLSIKF